MRFGDLFRAFFLPVEDDPPSIERMRILAWLRLLIGLPGLYIPNSLAVMAVLPYAHGRDISEWLFGAWSLISIAMVVANVILLRRCQRDDLSPETHRLAYHITVFSLLIELFTTQLTLYQSGSLITLTPAFSLVVIAGYRILIDYRTSFIATCVASVLFCLVGILETSGWVVVTPLLGSPLNHIYYEQPFTGLPQLWISLSTLLGTFGMLNYSVNEKVRLQQFLAKKSATLEVALTDLRSTQAKMVHQARMASLGNLVSGIAHEIGNPLNVSMNGAAGVRDSLEAMDSMVSEDSEDKAHKGLAGELKGTERLLNYVDKGHGRILTFKKRLEFLVDASRDGADEPCSLRGAIEGALDLLAVNIEEHHIEVAVNVPIDLAVLGNPAALTESFANILLNSCQAMPEGGEIRVDAKVAESSNTLFFHDTGDGIDVAIRDRVFDPLFTTKSPEIATGLGLTLAHTIVTQHGGTIEVGDTDAGALIVVSLPTVAL